MLIKISIINITFFLFICFLLFSSVILYHSDYFIMDRGKNKRVQKLLLPSHVIRCDDAKYLSIQYRTIIDLNLQLISIKNKSWQIKFLIWKKKLLWYGDNCEMLVPKTICRRHQCRQKNLTMRDEHRT